MANPHSMGKWRSSSATHVSSMDGNDFFSNEKSATIKENQAGFARIEFTDPEGGTEDLKTGIKHYLIVDKLNFIVLIWFIFFCIYI